MGILVFMDLSIWLVLVHDTYSHVYIVHNMLTRKQQMVPNHEQMIFNSLANSVTYECPERAQGVKEALGTQIFLRLHDDTSMCLCACSMFFERQ
jgi:hypothetical protein